MKEFVKDISKNTSNKNINYFKTNINDFNFQVIETITESKTIEKTFHYNSILKAISLVLKGEIPPIVLRRDITENLPIWKDQIADIINKNPHILDVDNNEYFETIKEILQNRIKNTLPPRNSKRINSIIESFSIDDFLNYHTPTRETIKSAINNELIHPNIDFYENHFFPLIIKINYLAEINSKENINPELLRYRNEFEKYIKENEKKSLISTGFLGFLIETARS